MNDLNLVFIGTAFAASYVLGYEIGKRHGFTNGCGKLGDVVRKWIDVDQQVKVDRELTKQDWSQCQ
jgi:hypothetical protein